MVEFETIKSTEIMFGKSNFIEIARKKAVTPEGENEFISLSRGFYMLDKQKRYRKSLTLPLSKEVIDFVSEKIKEMI
jgi:regulatory protein YycH of two-component signal transduction system YycFG